MRFIGKKRPFSKQVAQSTGSGKVKKSYRTEELTSSMYMTTEEIQAFFKVVKSKRDRAMFRIVYHRGLRAHEVGLLEMADYRDRDGILYVKRGKGSVCREHKLGDEELRCLRAYLRNERGTAPGPLFPSRQGVKGITRRRLDQIVKDYCKLAKIAPEKAHMHAFKHSCGTHLADRGFQAREIQDHLGHRASSSTDVYMHFSPSQRAALAEKLRSWI